MYAILPHILVGLTEMYSGVVSLFYYVVLILSRILLPPPWKESVLPCQLLLFHIDIATAHCVCMCVVNLLTLIWAPRFPMTVSLQGERTNARSWFLWINHDRVHESSVQMGSLLLVALVLHYITVFFVYYSPILCKYSCIRTVLLR